MTGTPAFLVFFSLIARLHAIPLAIDGLAVFAVSCALLLLARLEGAISWQTEIDTGTSAAATPNAPDTAPPEHRPLQPRAQRRQRQPLSMWRRFLQLRRLMWPDRPSRRRLLAQPTPLLLRPLSRALSRAPNPLCRRSRHSATFPILAHGASIASG